MAPHKKCICRNTLSVQVIKSFMTFINTSRMIQGPDYTIPCSVHLKVFTTSNTRSLSSSTTSFVYVCVI